LYVRQGLGKEWYESLLDVAGQAGAAVAESYGGKLAGDAVRAGHQIWTGLAFKDKGGGGSGPPQPPSPPPVVAQLPRFPPNGGVASAPPRATRPIVMMPAARPTPPVRPLPIPPAPVMSAGILGGGGSSKGLLIFGAISVAAIGIYLLTQKKNRGR
jgi:hypothetical protein